MGEVKPELFVTPRTGVEADGANPVLAEELVRIWGKNDGYKLLDLWQQTQVREPYSIEEVEDVYFEEVLG